MAALLKYKWINHEQNIISQFANFWKQELFTDCTILCGGKKFPAHRLVLASCSDYFKEVFDDVQCCHPIIIMKDISSENLQILLNYIYQVNWIIPQRKLLVVTEEGRALKIKGFEAPIKMVSNTCSSVKSDIVENFRLLQKSLSPVVSITKLDDVHRDISMKRKVPKEWDCEKKVRKVDKSACVVKVKVVKDKDSLLSFSTESCGLENFFEASNNDEFEFIGFDDANRKQDEGAFHEEEKINIENVFNDVKPDFSFLTNSSYLEVLNQRQEEECLDEDIVKEEEEILPFPLEKSVHHDSLPTLSQSNENNEQLDSEGSEARQTKSLLQLNQFDKIPGENGNAQLKGVNPGSEMSSQKATENTLLEKADHCIGKDLKGGPYFPPFSKVSQLLREDEEMVSSKHVKNSAPTLDIIRPPASFNKVFLFDDNCFNEEYPAESDIIPPPYKFQEEYTDNNLYIDNDSSVVQSYDKTFVPSPSSTSCSTIFKEKPKNSVKMLSVSSNFNNIRETQDVTPSDVKEEVNSKTLASSGIEVQTSKDTSSKSRKNCCPFCMKFVTQLPRHMVNKHFDEVKVKKFMSYPKGSEERALILEELRCSGNFKHNAEVLRRGKGTIVPIIRPTKLKTEEKFVPCKNCHGFYNKSYIWMHNAKCKLKIRPHLTGRRLIGHGLNLLSDQKINKKFMEVILGPMITDSVNLAIRNDFLILKLGEAEYLQHPEAIKHQYMRSRMRELGRLLTILREVDTSIKSLRDVIQLQKFESIITAVKKMSGFDGVSHFEKGSLVIKVGGHLKKCAEILSGVAMNEGDEELSLKAEMFIKRWDEEWGNCILPLAIRDLHVKKFNRPKLLPLVEDIQILHKYIKCESQSTYSNLIYLRNDMKKTSDLSINEKKTRSQLFWYQLLRLTLSSVILSNRKRSVEAGNITVENFEKGVSGNTVCPDLLTSNSDFDNSVGKYFKRIEIMGKKGKKVQVVLSKSNIQFIELLIEMRHIVGVASENVYIFARPNNGSILPVVGSTALRDVLKQSGVKNPETIISANLRKHIATMSQVLNLSHSELEELCKFMGFDVRVETDYSRLPDDAVQLGKITKLLIATQTGKLSKYRNQSLSEIITDEDLVSDESGVESDDEVEEEAIEPPTKVPRVQPSSDRKPKFQAEEGETFEEASTSALQGSKSRKFSRKEWEKKEKNVVLKHFRLNIRKQKLPGKQECEACIKKYNSILHSRKWTQIKNFIRNRIVRINKRRNN